MDIITVGEMVIDFIPGTEEGSYIRNPGVRRPMWPLRRPGTDCPPESSARWGTMLLAVS